VAEEYGKIVDKQVSDADLKSLVGKLIAGKGTRDEKAASILAYLDREVRYTGVEFGESAMVPYSPSETLARKYGDCKDKASLLLAMLRVANVPPYIALLHVGNREDVFPIFLAWACSITPSFTFPDRLTSGLTPLTNMPVWPKCPTSIRGGLL
jgi:Transglutaminase-like superfamily